MKTLIAILSLTLMSQAALAGDEDNYIIKCGEGRSKGVKDAELAVVHRLENTTLFYLNGVALKDEEFDVGGREEFWIITIYAKGGDYKYEISEKTKKAQKYTFDAEENEQKAGRPLACIIPDEA